MLRLSARLGVDEDVWTYMKNVSRRLKEWNGAVIRADSCENFINDLEENGFIIILKGITVKYYFAYGSNLNMEQMSNLCPDAVPLVARDLPGWELQFRRVLTIVRNPKGVVRGGLWLISDFDEKMLDRYEGYPGWYEKHFITFPDGLTAMTYILTKGKKRSLKGTGCLPSGVYGLQDRSPQGLLQGLSEERKESWITGAVALIRVEAYGRMKRPAFLLGGRK